MHPAKECVDIAASVCGFPRSHVDQRTRALIDAGILPKSKGKQIALLNAEQLFLIIACSAFSDRRADAPNVALAFRDLPLAVGDKLIGEGGPGLYFENALEMHSYKSCRMELSATRNGYVASLWCELASSTGQESEILLSFFRNPKWGGYTKRTFALSSEGFQVMRNLWSRPTDDVVEIK